MILEPGSGEQFDIESSGELVRILDSSHAQPEPLDLSLFDAEIPVIRDQRFMRKGLSSFVWTEVPDDFPEQEVVNPTISARNVGLRKLPPKASVIDVDGKFLVQIDIDPNSYKDLYDAHRTVASLTKNRLVLGDTSSEIDTKLRPEPPEHFDTPLGPKGTINVLVGREPDDPFNTAEAVKNGVMTFTAASVLAGSLVIGTPTKSNSSATDRPASISQSVESLTKGNANENPKPIEVELVSTEVSYKVEKPMQLLTIANDLHTPLKKLREANPNISATKPVPAGTIIGGIVKGSKLKLPAPRSVEDIAEQYGASSQAIASVNKFDENGVVSGEVVVPGRQVVPVPENVPVNHDVIAQHLGLSIVGIREFERLNAAVPVGEVVVPMYESIPKPLLQPEVISSVLTGQITPGSIVPVEPTNETTFTTTSSVPTTTIEQVSTTTTSLVSNAETTTTATSPPETTSTTSTTPNTTIAPEVAPAPEPAPLVAVERSATELEQFEADKKEIASALEIARTTGNAGPLNHIVYYSPIFKPYDLPDNLQTGDIRYLPPANYIGVPGLNYELAPITHDKQSHAAAAVVAQALLASYILDYNTTYVPEFQPYKGSCIRIGHLTAKGHDSHDGEEIDMTSSLHCDINNGHEIADGPIFWINHDPNGINRNVTNPNYNPKLDNIVLQALLNAKIDGVPIFKSILYNSPWVDPSGIVVYTNHSNHIHGNSTNNAHRGGPLREWAIGGERPPADPGEWLNKVYLSYVGGLGVPGVSLDLKITEFVTAPPALDPIAGAVVAVTPTPPPATVPETVPTPPPADVPVPTLVPAPETAPITEAQPAPAEPSEIDKYTFIEALFLNEISSGEGGYDSVNRGRAGDTKIGDGNYKNIFGEKPLSQHTVGELMDLQRKGKILAIGKYQFIGSTFASAVSALHINPNQVFDPATQDFMAANYLINMKRPNLAAYIKGDESKQYLAQEDLCKEFASIPCNDGTGYYDGDSAGNGASGGRERVRKFKFLLKALQLSYLGASKEVLQEFADQMQAQ